MDLGIHGRVALVTGASQGLGFAVAAALAAEGAKVAVCSRSSGQIRDAAARINEVTGRDDAVAIVADLSDHKSRESIVPRVHVELGPVEICVINSGGPPSGPFESHSPESWLEVVDEHLGGALSLVRAALPDMRNAGWGRIITITSCSVKQPASGMILSNTSRAAVVGFVRTLANEVAPQGITVNNLMPGYTHTSRIDELAQQISARTNAPASEIVGRWESEIPMGRLGRPEEFGAVAAFLCSTQASYVTGTSLSVDGGWNRGLF